MQVKVIFDKATIAIQCMKERLSIQVLGKLAIRRDRSEP